MPSLPSVQVILDFWRNLCVQHRLYFGARAATVNPERGQHECGSASCSVNSNFAVSVRLLERVSRLAYVEPLLRSLQKTRGTSGVVVFLLEWNWAEDIPRGQLLNPAHIPVRSVIIWLRFHKYPQPAYICVLPS